MKKKKEELTEFEKSVIAKLYQGASLAGKDGALLTKTLRTLRIAHYLLKLRTANYLLKHYALFALVTDY
jgi:hypothetical protein